MADRSATRCSRKDYTSAFVVRAFVTARFCPARFCYCELLSAWFCWRGFVLRAFVGSPTIRCVLFNLSHTIKTIAPNTRRLEACLSDLHAWFSHNWLALNPSKSEALLLVTSQRFENPFNAWLGQHLGHHCTTYYLDQIPWCHSQPVSFL